MAEQRAVPALRGRDLRDEARLVHNAAVGDRRGDQRHVHRRGEHAPLTDGRPRQILGAQVVDGVAGIVDDQIAEHEVPVEAHLLRRIAQHLIAEILRERGEGRVAGARECVGQGLHPVRAAVCDGVVAHGIIARAVKREIVQIGQIFQRGGQRHDFERRAGRIQSLRRAVDERARSLVRQRRIHVRRVELRHGDHRQNLVRLVIEHDDRAALARGELLADVAGEPLGDRQPDVVAALGRAGKGVGQPLEDAGAEAQQKLRVERVRAGGDLAAAVADHLTDRLARRRAAVVAPPAVLIRIGQHRAVPVGQRAHDDMPLLAADARVIGVRDPAPAVEIDGVAEIRDHQREHQHQQQRQQVHAPLDNLDKITLSRTEYLLPDFPAPLRSPRAESRSSPCTRAATSRRS